jgi:hypothetical protein
VLANPAVDQKFTISYNVCIVNNKEPDMEPNIFETGHDAIRDTINEQVSWMFSDAEEIGSSDVTACVRAVFSSLGYETDRATDYDYDIIRGAVYRAIARLEQRA